MGEKYRRWRVVKTADERGGWWTLIGGRAGEGGDGSRLAGYAFFQRVDCERREYARRNT